MICPLSTEGKHYCYDRPSLYAHPLCSQFCTSRIVYPRMFDHIDQPPQVPLYPSKRPLHPRAQWMSYSVGHSPGSDPSHASPHRLPPSKTPPPRTFKAQEENPYLLSSINDVGERRIPVNTSSRTYARVGLPVSDRVEARRSIHHYDSNGVSEWRASEVGSTAGNDAVGTRAELQPHDSSLGLHPSELDVHPARCPQRQPVTGHGGRTRVRNIWTQQAPGEWDTDGGSSATAAAAPAAPGGTTWSISGGPAWGGGGGGAWN